MKKSRFLTSVLIGIICAAITVMIILAYTGPTANPPLEDAPEPVRTDDSSQTKSGSLNIMGNVGVGTSDPLEKLHVTGALRVDAGLGGAIKMYNPEGRSTEMFINAQASDGTLPTFGAIPIFIAYNYGIFAKNGLNVKMCGKLQI